jgi:hypothetical protein
MHDNGKIVEQVQNFRYLDCDISHKYGRGLIEKVHKFQSMFNTIRRALINKNRKDTMFTFYNVMAVLVLWYGSENWSVNRAHRRIAEAAERESLGIQSKTE